MKKWIRWQGLAMFSLVAAGLLAFFLLFIDGFVKRMIEKTGTAIVGARVDLDKADLSLFPLGLTLDRLQVTNPDEPMTNAVEITRIAFLMDGLNLLRRKVIIDEMTVEEVRMNTPRERSGEIARRPSLVPSTVKKAVGKLQLPSLEIPDVGKILEKEELESLRLMQEVRDEISQRKAKWQQKLDELPDKAKLEEYRERIQKIKSARKGGLGGILGGASELVSLRKELKQDRDRIRSVRDTFKSDFSELRNRVEEVSRAPLKDVRRLKEKYSLSPEGLSNVSRLLLGGKIGGWTETALRWHKKLKPVLARVSELKKDKAAAKPPRGKGVDVRFKEDHPLPDFLIRAAMVSVEIPAGTLSGEVMNVTPDQDMIGVPLTFNFSGKEMKDLESVTLKGEMNRVNPSDPRDEVNLNVAGYRIRNMTLSKNKDLPVSLKEGLTDFTARAVLVGDALDATVSAGLKSVKITSALPEDARPLAKAMASTLGDIRSFNLQATVSGSVTDYKIRLTSDLDRVLKDAIGRQVREQAARFEKRLTSAISEKVDEQLADLKSRLGGFDSIADELTKRLNLGDGLLKEAAAGAKGGLKLPF